MRILDFGSLNIDHTYRLPHLMREGETLASSIYMKSEGGKGFNQAVALRRAGSRVLLAGAIGSDGVFLTDYLQSVGVDTSCVKVVNIPTGHAIIQVDDAGNNSILLYGGANQMISDEMICQALDTMDAGDYVLLQNEINGCDRIIRAAYQRRLKIVLNPSPVSKELLLWPLQLVDWLILNEIEGQDMTGCTEPDAIADELLRRYPALRVVLTLGDRGSVYADAHQRIHQRAICTTVVDSTAAGDTFTGYFFHAILQGESAAYALHLGAYASSIAIGRKGAAQSIPSLEEVLAAISEARVRRA